MQSVQFEKKPHTLGFSQEHLIAHQLQYQEELIDQRPLVHAQVVRLRESIESMRQRLDSNEEDVITGLRTALLFQLLNYPVPVPNDKQGILDEDWIRYWLIDIDTFVKFIEQSKDSSRRSYMWSPSANPESIATALNALPPLELIEEYSDTVNDETINMCRYNTAVSGIEIEIAEPVIEWDLHTGRFFEVPSLMPRYVINEDNM